MRIVLITLLLGAISALTGCSEQLEFKEKTRDVAIQKKSDIDTESVFLYVPVTGDTLRSAGDARPHFVGTPKLAKFVFNRSSLDIVEIEKDGRFKDNPQNQAPILSIPIEHVDYKCSEDDYGKCTNKEEEDSDKQYYQKRYFIPDLENLRTEEVNSTQHDLGKYFSGCYVEKDQEEEQMEVGSDSVIIDVVKTIQIQSKCSGIITRLEQLSSLTYNMKYTYNMIKLDAYSSPSCDNENTPLNKQAPGCYSPIVYPRERDENTFGYFATVLTEKDVDNNDTQDGYVQHLDRFNPKKGIIDYYLSDGFFKPENKVIKEATYEAVKRINDSLMLADAGIQIRLNEQPGLNTGDIRKNMIIMVEDPVAAGLLGYGPSITNPHTGEILHARNVMYLGTIKRFVKRAYEFLRLEREAQKMAPAMKTGDDSVLDLTGGAKSTFEVISGLNLSGDKADPGQKLPVPGNGNDHSHGDGGLDIGDLSHDVMIHSIMKMAETQYDVSPTNLLPHLSREDWGVIYNIDPDYLPEDIEVSNIRIFETLAKHNVFHASMFNFEDAVGKSIKDAFPPDADLKPWALLNDSEKQEVLDALLPYTWIQTFIHEMGHNLGLRHNFEGSEDKENYYSDKELQDMGVDFKIPYSSVMDYAYSSLNELPVMGKYDIAAFRFAYARKIEDKAGNLHDLKISVPGSDGQLYAKELTLEELPSTLELKDYGFCTDDHVGANPGCNRFDEGTSLAEIAQHMVDSYHAFYKIRNTRQDAATFSLLDEPTHVLRKIQQFFELRRFYELRERLKEDFGITDEMFKNPPSNFPPETRRFLRDIDKSAVIAANFFMDIIKMPDVQCLMVNAADGGLLGVVPLRDVDMSSLDCSKVRLPLRDGRVAVSAAEGGRFFQNQKSPDNPDANVSEIDIRGIMPEKVIATHFLFARSVGSIIFDRNTTPMISHPEVLPKALQLVGNIMFDDFQEVVNFRIGETDTLPIRLGYQLDMEGSHLIKAPLMNVVGRMLGVPVGIGEMMFSERVLEGIEENLPTSVDVKSKELMRMFSVFRSDDVYRDLPKNPVEREKSMISFGPGSRYYAFDDNVIAKSAILSVLALRNLSVFETERLEFLYEQLVENDGRMPRETTFQERKILSLFVKNLDLIKLYLDGRLKDEVYYERLLSQLPWAEKYR